MTASRPKMIPNVFDWYAVNLYMQDITDLQLWDKFWDHVSERRNYPANGTLVELYLQEDDGKAYPDGGPIEVEGKEWLQPYYQALWDEYKYLKIQDRRYFCLRLKWEW